MFIPARRKARGFFLVNASQTNSPPVVSMGPVTHFQEAPVSIRRSRAPLVCLAGLSAALWFSAAVAASATTASKSGGQSLPSKVTFIDAPSSESPQAREKRLKRECKGRPNAGMCLGHTR
jgi:hypothetical protein